MKSWLDKSYSGFIRAPLFWSAALLGLGIALEEEFNFAPEYAAAIPALVAGASICAVLSRWKKSRAAADLAFIMLAALVFSAGAFYYKVWLPPLDWRLMGSLDREEPVRIKLRAQATSESFEKYSRVLADLEWLDRGKGPEKCPARLWLDYHSEQQFFPGDEFIAFAHIKPIKGFFNPFVPNPARRFVTAGIYYSASQVEEIPLFKANLLKHPIKAALMRYREMVSEELDRSGARSSYLLAAMLLGDKDAVPPEVWNLFVATSSVHILVISGFNLSLVGGFCFFIILGFFRLQPWLLKRINPYPVAGILAVIPITFYALITGLEIPTFRALIMVWLLLLAVALRRTRDLLNALGLAALIILLLNPSALFEASFQLSFMSVLVLVPYFPALWKLLGGPWLDSESRLVGLEKGKYLPKLRAGSLLLFKYFYAIFLVTVLIQLFLAPMNAYYFSQMNLSGPFANMLLVPICGFWVYPVGIIGLWIAGLWPGLADKFFELAGWGAWLMEKIAGAFASLPRLSLMVRTPTSSEVFGWFILLFGIFELARILARHKNAPQKKLRNLAWGFAWVALLVASGGGLVARGWHEITQARLKPDEARVCLLDVGLGQSLLIELPDSKRILIDGGGRLGAINLGQAVVARFLLANGIRDLDLVILTHPETDHSAGLEYILDKFEVHEFLLPDRINPIAQTLLEIAEKHKIKIKLFNSDLPPIFISGAKFTFLNPPGEVNKKLTLNDTSAVLKMEYGKTAILFPSEISSKIEDQMVKKYGEKLKSRILIASHHGSKSSSDANFLSAVSPSLILISGAESRHLKLPSPEALARMAATGATILRTDLDGEIEISLTPESATARTFHGKSLLLR